MQTRIKQELDKNQTKFTLAWVCLVFTYNLLGFVRKLARVCVRTSWASGNNRVRVFQQMQKMLFRVSCSHGRDDCPYSCDCTRGPSCGIAPANFLEVTRISLRTYYPLVAALTELHCLVVVWFWFFFLDFSTGKVVCSQAATVFACKQLLWIFLSTGELVCVVYELFASSLRCSSVFVPKYLTRRLRVVRK